MMEYEQNIERRIAYSECLLIILQAANLGIVRWTVKILDIIDDYSKTDVTELNSMVVSIYYTEKIPLRCQLLNIPEFVYELGSNNVHSYWLVVNKQTLEENKFNRR